MSIARTARLLLLVLPTGCGLIADLPDGRLAPDGAGGAAGSGGAVGSGGESSAYAAAVLDDGPAAYWRLGETGRALKAIDASPNGHHGDYSGSVMVDETGALAGDPDLARHFDSSGEVNAGPILNFDGNVSYTLEAWVKPEGAEPHFLFGKAVYQGNPVYDGYTVTLNNGLLGTSRGPMGVGINSDAPLEIGAWTHVAIVYDTSLKLTIYENGVSTISVADGTPMTTPEDAVFQIGLNANFAGFKGTIDEVAVYDYPLQIGRISAHCEIGSGSPCPQ